MKRRFWIPLVVLVVLIAAYGALHLNPEPLFPYELQVGTVVLHARAPFPHNTRDLLAQVEARLARSPLHRPDRAHHVFLCDTPALYAFFSPHHPRTGGETYFWLGNVIFLRPSDLAADRLIGPSGKHVPEPRTLVYFITHELVHALTYDALGLRGYLALERWQEDGYADYIANPDFDAAAALARLRQGDPQLDPAKSGLYLRYQLLVHRALESGLSVEELLSTRRDQQAAESTFLSSP